MFKGVFPSTRFKVTTQLFSVTHNLALTLIKICNIFICLTVVCLLHSVVSSMRAEKTFFFVFFSAVPFVWSTVWYIIGTQFGNEWMNEWVFVFEHCLDPIWLTIFSVLGCSQVLALEKMMLEG